MMLINNLKKSLIYVALIAFLSLNLACSKSEPESSNVKSQENSQTTSGVVDANKKLFAEAYAAADTLRQEAASLQYEWRDTEMYLLEAKEKFVSGEFDVAMQLLTKPTSNLN